MAEAEGYFRHRLQKIPRDKENPLRMKSVRTIGFSMPGSKSAYASQPATNETLSSLRWFAVTANAVRTTWFAPSSQRY
jgi:hypothetical protein